MDTRESSPIVVTERVVGIVGAPDEPKADEPVADDPGIAGAAGTIVFTLLPATLPVMSAMGTV